MIIRSLCPPGCAIVTYGRTIVTVVVYPSHNQKTSPVVRELRRSPELVEIHKPMSLTWVLDTDLVDTSYIICWQFED